MLKTQRDPQRVAEKRARLAGLDDLKSGDKLVNVVGGERAVFMNYLPDDFDYDMQLHSLDHDDGFSAVATAWRRL